jgi:hypothetical protein
VYNDSARILLLGGELVKPYDLVQFKDVLKNCSVVPTLINGRKMFKPIVLKLAEIFQIMYGKICQP